MLKKLSVFVSLAFAAMLFPAVSASAQVSADTYGPPVPTQTHISILVGKAGEPIVVNFWVTANRTSNARVKQVKKPTGTLDISIASKGSGAAGAQAVAPKTFSKSIRFTGQRVKVSGPKLSPGRYLVAASFTPDNESLFLSSRDVKSIKVGQGGSNPNDSDSLPNTGGPDLWLLLVGGGLIVGGAGSVVYARRRRQGGAAAA